MKNNKKKTRMTKVEKRRLAFEKRNVKKEQNLARYGAEGGSALVMAKTTEFNRRMLAALLALVFVLTSVVVGYNIATKAQGHDEDSYGMMETVDDETGMVLRKGYKQTAGVGTDTLDDDVYSLRLEAYSTKDTTVKKPEDSTPLDIVMVLDQSGTMTTPDVFTGNYNEITDTTTFSVNDAVGKYIKVGDKYYEVKSRQGQYAYDSAGTGPWTVTDAGNGSHYYYDSTSDKYYLVEKKTGTLDYTKAYPAGMYLDDWILHSSTRWSLNTYWTRKNAGDFFVYNKEYDNAFYLIIRESGHTGISSSDRYYDDEFFYFPDYDPKLTESNIDNYVRHSTGWTSTADPANDDYSNSTIKHVTVPVQGGSLSPEKAYIKRNGLFDTDDVIDNTQSLTVPLYKHQSTTGYNRVGYTIDGIFNQLGRTITIDPDVQDVYSGELFVKGDGYELYYEDDNGNPVPISNYGVKTTTEPAFSGTLYTRDNITRLEAQELAANNFAEQIAANIGDRNYRIAVVGNANSGTIYSGDQNAANAFVTDSAEVETAITALTNATANGTLLSDGLGKAAEIFQANPLDSADARKRIVIVFGDEDTWTSAQTNDASIRTSDATLKDTYNSTVYTIGLFDGAPNSTTETFMSQLSSEYFFSVANASNTGAYKQMDGTYHYLANSNVFPDEADSIISTFGTVANTAIASPKTEFVLDNTTAFLKDVIHENFNLPTGNTTVEVATGTYNNGTLTWGAASTASNVTATWGGENNRTLTVTGFDYDANYVSESRPASTGSGQKIIITIDGLTVNQRVRTESKSAKRIYFNTSDSAIYKDGAEELLVNKFPRPFLDDETWLAPEGGTGRMNDDGVVVNKYLTPTEGGTYDLTVEAYTTRTSSTTIEKIPTDFIVVADQSGSMDETDMPTGYKAVSGTKTLEQIANGKYYVKGADGNYYRVYGTRSYMYRYYPANYFYVGDLIDRFGERLDWFQAEDEAGQSITNQMYFREVVDGQTYYQPLTMTVQGKIGTYYIRFSFDSQMTGRTYQFDRNNTQYSSNGNSPWYRNVITGGTMKSGVTWRLANAAVQTLYPTTTAYTFSELLGANTGMFINYPMYDRHVGYNQLLYRDANGTEHILSATTGQTSLEFCDDNGYALTSATGTQPTYSGLYEATGYQSRLDALKNALTEFAQAVADESHLNNEAVDNRIAIVGFSSPSYSTFQNTELLTGENLTISNKNGKRIDQATDSDYATALVSATDGNVGTINSKITDAIDALTANGGTQPEDGLNMAYNILNKRTLKTYTLETGDKSEVDRNTIVIYFTDGRPGDYTYSNQYKEANEVVNAAKNIKSYSNPKGGHPNVFSIGVFGESDGNPLTYTAHQVSSKNAEYEYELGWTETYRYKNGWGIESGDYYYLNRNWRSGSPVDHGATANDTIYDYMSTVSSNYPNATQYMKVKESNTAGEADLAGYSNYLDMLEGVRGTYIGNNDYYRMASNQATLVAAFAQAVTMMNQTISSEQRLDAASVVQDVFNNTEFTVEDGYSIRATTVDGSMDKYGTVNFDESTEAPATGVITNLRTVNGNQTMTVTGFDYLANYITSGYTDSQSGAVIDPHDGKKLVVTISNVVPTATGAQFYSNISSNNASSMYVNDRSVTDTDFPTPSISRHKYTLDVRDVNPNATFTVAATIVDGSGQKVAADSSMLDDVIIVYPNGTRKLYKDVDAQTFLEVKNGESIYFENLPSGYQVKTDVTATDDAYIYSIWFDESESSKQRMTKGTPISNTFDYLDDHVIHIESVRGTKQVTIREETIGSYGNKKQIFGEAITMEIPVIQGETTQLEYDCTFNDDYCGFENGLPSDATYKAVFEVDPESTTLGQTVTKLVGIKYTKNGTTTTWPVSNNQLPMRDGDVITFTAVPVGNTVKVQEGDSYDHEVFYYYGQNNVAASGIKLEASNGELLGGTHTFTFAPVDGTDADDLTITFENGSITKINNDDVTATSAIDFAEYQRMYVINDDLSDAMLNIDGTTVSFDAETNGDDTAYVATIKREKDAPPVSVTVERNDMDILVINEKGDIEIEGIFDNHHSKGIYILAGFGVLALAAGGYYVYRKKDEFVAQ